MKRWSAPQIRNMNCGMEVTSYDSSELDDEFLGATLQRQIKSPTTTTNKNAK